MNMPDTSLTTALMGANPAAGALYMAASERSTDATPLYFISIALVMLAAVGLLMSPAATHKQPVQNQMPVEAIQKAFAESTARAREARK